MRSIPDSEMALLEVHAEALTDGLCFEEGLFKDGLVETSDPTDFISNAALAAIAVAKVAGVVRNRLRHSDDPAALKPDLIVATPRSAWLGKGVGLAVGLDFMPLIEQGTDGVQCGSVWTQRCHEYGSAVVVTSLLDDSEVVAKVLRLSQIDGRAMAAVTLVDERSVIEPQISGIPLYTIFPKESLEHN